MFCFFRQSWTQCTSTSLGFIWSVPVIFFSFPTPPSGPMCSKRLSLSELQLTKTRKSPNSRLIIIPLLKASGIPELEDLRKSKNFFFCPRDVFFMWTSHSGKSSFLITIYDLYFWFISTMFVLQLWIINQRINDGLFPGTLVKWTHSLGLRSTLKLRIFD